MRQTSFPYPVPFLLEKMNHMGQQGTNHEQPSFVTLDLALTEAQGVAVT